MAKQLLLVSDTRMNIMARSRNVSLAIQANAIAELQGVLENEWWDEVLGQPPQLLGLNDDTDIN